MDRSVFHLLLGTLLSSLVGVSGVTALIVILFAVGRISSISYLLFSSEILSLHDLLKVFALLDSLEPLLLSQVVHVDDCLTGTLTQVDHAVLILILVNRLNLYPLRHLPVLDQPIVVVAVVFKTWFHLLNFLHPLSSIFSIKHVSVHLLELLELLWRSRQHLIDLVEVWNLTLSLSFIFIIVISLSDKFLQLLLSIGVACIVIEHTSLDNFVIKAFLVSGLRKNTLLYLGCSDETEHSHFVLLTDSVRSILGLLIHLWIPIRVKDNNGVRNLQVKSMSSSLG